MRIILNFGKKKNTIQIDNEEPIRYSGKKFAKQLPLILLYYIVQCHRRGEIWDSKDYYEHIPDTFGNARPVVRKIQCCSLEEEEWEDKYVLAVVNTDFTIDRKEGVRIFGSKKYKDSEGDIVRILVPDYQERVNQCINYLNKVIFIKHSAAINDDDEKNYQKWDRRIINKVEREEVSVGEFDDDEYDKEIEEEKKLERISIESNVGIYDEDDYDYEEDDLPNYDENHEDPTSGLYCYGFDESMDGQEITLEVVGNIDSDLMLLGLKTGKWTYLKRHNDSVEAKKQKYVNRGEEIRAILKKGKSAYLQAVRHDKKRLFWDGATIKEIAEKYGNRSKRIDDTLLPKVSTSLRPESYNTISDFIKDFTNNELYLEGKSRVAIVEGKMGSGKTYSLSRAAKELCDAGHYAFVVPLYALHQDEDKRQTLSSYLCEYMQGSKGNDPLLAVQTLLQQSYEFEDGNMDGSGNETQNDNKPPKVVIIVDCVDETYTGSYESLASEISLIMKGKDRVKNKRVKHKNNYFILATRDSNTFKKNIDMSDDIWRDVVDVRIEPLDESLFSGELKKMMHDNEDFRTPLFASYFREIENLLDDNTKTDAAKNIMEYGKIAKYRSINSYYDLFDIRTQLLIEHARVGGNESFLYSSVIPYMAYYLLRDDIVLKKSFGKDELYEMLSADFEKEDLDDYQIIACETIDDANNLFRYMSEDALASEVLKTGIIVEVPNGNSENIWEFEHQEYMQFLAAYFASNILEIDWKSKTSQNILIDALEKVSHHNNPIVVEEKAIIPKEQSREDKVAIIPFSYYLIRLLTDEYKDHGKRPDFDPLYYLMVTNIGCEKIYDVWDASKEMVKKLKKYYVARNNYQLNCGNKRAYKSFFESPELINATNAFLYTTITNPKFIKNIEKIKSMGEYERILASDILSGLESCALKTLGIIFTKLDEFESFREIYLSSNKNGKDGPDFFITIMDCLIQFITDRKNLDFDSWPFDIDLIGRIYSNLGAVKLQQGKCSYKNGNSSYKEYLAEAEEYHTRAKKYREAISKVDNGKYRSEVSIVRSLITLATDKFFQGLYSDNLDNAIDYYSNAIDDHKEALKQLGVSFENSCNLELGKPISYGMDTHAEETGHTDTEPFVVFVRIAGCFYEMWKLMKEKDTAYSEDLLTDQLISIKAATIYLYSECLDNDRKNQLHPGKLEINAAEINNLFKECTNNYAGSFSFLEGDARTESVAVLNIACHMHEILHKNQPAMKFEDDGSQINLIQ